MPRYKITIDHDTCIACTVCYSLCPEVFEANDDGRSILIEQFRRGAPTEGEIGDDLYSCVKDVKENCPTDSIKIEQIE